MPDFNASATKTPFGPCEVTAYGKNYTLSGAANSLYVLNTHGTNTTVADTGWTIPTLQPYTAIWGASAPVTMESQNGWTASFNLETIEEPSDSYNMGDILAGNMNVTLTGDIHQVIVGGNSAGVESTLAAQFTLEKAIGDDWSETAKAYDIVISPIATAKRALTLTLKQMKLDSMQPTFGIAKQRILGVTFVNADEVTDGAVASAFAFTAVA
jgi:hypothetical protein